MSSLPELWVIRSTLVLCPRPVGGSCWRDPDAPGYGGRLEGARRGGPLLKTVRFLRTFGGRGWDVVPAMLDRARFKAEAAGLSVRWVEDDARDFDLDSERFRLIFLTGNAFQAFLTGAHPEALLGRVRAHLHDEGLFAFETRNPRWRTSEGRDEDPDGLFVYLETRAEEEALPPHTNAHGREVRESRSRTYDHVAQVLHWTSYQRWHEGGAQERTKTTRIALRFTFPQELAALLHHNGFTIARRYGDWDGEPLTAASPSIIVVCRKHT